MAKQTTKGEDLTPEQIEALAMADIDEREGREPVEEHDDFLFVADRPLPEGFVNPPPGKEGHRCVEFKTGHYKPDWTCIRINKIHENQADPQAFPLAGRTWLVPLDEWCDVPPEVIESLRSAVETHHSQVIRPQDVLLGRAPEIKSTDRRRFVWEMEKSA